MDGLANVTMEARVGGFKPREFDLRTRQDGSLISERGAPSGHRLIDKRVWLKEASVITFCVSTEAGQADIFAALRPKGASLRRLPKGPQSCPLDP